MILFICDFCQTKYPSRISLKGATYSDADGLTHTAEQIDSPCFQCELKGDQAKAEALEKMKQQTQKGDHATPNPDSSALN